MKLNIDEFGLIIIIVLAGILGGSVNYITEKKDELGWKLWFNRVIVGIAASFLMPLFLETISSDLVHSVLRETESSSGDIFVLFGFCLVGAISSRALIRTLSEKILQEVIEVKEKAEKAKEEAEKTKKKVSELESEIDPIISQATEQDEIINDDSYFSELSDRLDENAISILKALIHPKYSLRSITGISKDAKLDISVVTDKLIVLIDEALATEVQGKRGPRWSITSKGYRVVEIFRK